jgi:hypothetical protein
LPLRLAGNLQIKASAQQSESYSSKCGVFGVTWRQSFPLKFAAVAPRHPKILAEWFIDRIIANRSAGKLFCHKLLEFYFLYACFFVYTIKPTRL